MKKVTLLFLLVISQIALTQEKTIADTLNETVIIFYVQESDDISSRLYGTMDYTGAVQIKPEYQHLTRVNKVNLVACKGKWNVYEGKEAKKVLKAYGRKDSDCCLNLYDLKGDYGVINSSNEIVIPFEYSYIHACCNSWNSGTGKNSNKVGASKTNNGAVYKYFGLVAGSTGSKHASNWAQNKGVLELELELK